MYLDFLTKNILCHAGGVAGVDDGGDQTRKATGGGGPRDSYQLG